MKILKRYIFDEWFALFFLSIVVITFILLVGNMVKLVELVVAKGIDGFAILRLVGYLMPSLLIYSIPIATLTATLLTFGRMAYDQELTAIRSSGISLYPVAGSMLLIATLLSLVCLYCNDSLIPWAHYQQRRIIRDIAVKNPAAYLEEKTFIKSFRGYIIFIYRVRDDYLQDIRIYQPQNDKPTRVIMAERGEFIAIPEKNAVKVALKNGTADEPSFDDPGSSFKINFQNSFIILELNDGQPSKELNKKPQDMTIKELEQEAATMRVLGVDERPLLVALHRKYALSFSSLIFALLGMPLAIRVKRRERSLGFGLSVLTCVVYYILLAVGENLALRNLISPAIGIWLANALLGLVGGWLFFRVLES